MLFSRFGTLFLLPSLVFFGPKAWTLLPHLGLMWSIAWSLTLCWLHLVPFVGQSGPIEGREGAMDLDLGLQLRQLSSRCLSNSPNLSNLASQMLIFDDFTAHKQWSSSRKRMFGVYDQFQLLDCYSISKLQPFASKRVFSMRNTYF